MFLFNAYKTSSAVDISDGADLGIGAKTIHRFDNNLLKYRIPRVWFNISVTFLKSFDYLFAIPCVYLPELRAQSERRKGTKQLSSIGRSGSPCTENNNLVLETYTEITIIKASMHSVEHMKRFLTYCLRI